MADEHPDEVAGAVTDGLDVDWDAALEAAPPEQRLLLEQLRVLSSISRASGFPPSPESVIVTRHWGPFDIDEELDRGSYGRVYRARDTRVDRDVAVKLLPGGTTPEDSGLAEARALGKVRHPNVVAVYGADQFDGIPGLWTEFVEGETIEQFLNTHGQLGGPGGRPRGHRPLRRARGGARRWARAPGRHGAQRDARAWRADRAAGLRRREPDGAGAGRHGPRGRHAALHGAGALRGQARVATERHLRPGRAPVPDGHQAVSGDRRHSGSACRRPPRAQTSCSRWTFGPTCHLPSRR